jgi:segregation and condensation protein B
MTTPDPTPPTRPSGGPHPPAPEVEPGSDLELAPTSASAAAGPGSDPAAVGPGSDPAAVDPGLEPGPSMPGSEVEPGGSGPRPGTAPSGTGAEQATQAHEPAPAGGDLADGGNAWPPDEAFDVVELDDRGWVRCNLEAILLVADEPVPATVLAEICGSRLSEVEELLIDLAGEYARHGRGFVLRTVAGGWRLYTHPGARGAVEAFLRAGQQSRLTRAALETLAVIAYQQPVTRFQVAAVRGVNVDGVFRTLLSRGLIREVGSDPGPGQASLYGTTPAFLEQLGLNALDQLPPIKDYLPEGIDLVELQEQP